MLRINDSQKHKSLYTWELCDVIINFQCAQDLLFWRIINSKLLQYVIDNLNLKGKVFFETHCRGKMSEEFERSLIRCGAPCQLVFTLQKLRSVLPSLKPLVDVP